MSIPTKLVCFAHGKESGPWGTKIKQLAGIAQSKGFQVLSPDYSMTYDADERVEKLLRLNPKASKCLVLVGSSMGGYVSMRASTTLKPKGLFLLAPAFYLPGYNPDSYTPCADFITLIHGWDDTVVPVENSLRFSREFKSDIHIITAGHRLKSRLPLVKTIFSSFLDTITE